MRKFWNAGNKTRSKLCPQYMPIANAMICKSTLPSELRF